MVALASVRDREGAYSISQDRPNLPQDEGGP
jgi:hypothetical protein